MGIRLSPDDLGQTGEDLFRRLCSQAQLVCNKSERDRAGWDFVVDLPIPIDGAKTLDQRAAPACVLQLKSTTNSNPARMALSKIERIAKDPRPAFIVVFRLAPDGREIAGYLIHLIGPLLGRVLQRLREAEAAGKSNIHKAFISFKYAEVGTRFEPTPEGLRQAIVGACSPNQVDYVRDKQHQLERLGYEDGGGLQAEAILWVESPQALSRVLVGLEPMKPIKLRAFDVRFGVAVPYTGSLFDDAEELRIEPPTIGPCRVTIRGAPLEPAAVFAAEAFVGPPVEIEGRVWVAVRHPEFIATISATGVEFQTEGNFARRARSLAAWTTITRALLYLSSGHGEISFQFQGDLNTRLAVPLSGDLDGPYLGTLPQLVRFIEAWSRLVEMAGVLATEAFSLNDLWAAKGVQIAADLMTNPATAAWMAFDAEAFDRGSDAVEALYFNSCRLADAAVTYCVKVTLQRIEGEYRSVAFTPVDARPEVGDLTAYAEECAGATGVRLLINPDNITEVSPPLAAPEV